MRSRHPWIFSGAVRAVEGDPGPGDLVEVMSADGDRLGHGYFSPGSKIRVRMASWSEEETPDWAGAIRRAAARRGSFGDSEARRLVYSESDGLPGLVVDRYGPWVVVQLLSAAAEARREETAAALLELPGVRGVYERSDAQGRELEGLPVRVGPLGGEELPARIEIVEEGRRFLVDPRVGHKTGFYLDQRENRRLLGTSSTGRVLNAYAYTGGFGIVAATAGASEVVHVDSSAEVLGLARENAALNSVGDGSEYVEADVPTELRRRRDRGETFDTIVLDPPKFARGAAQISRASRAYKDINLLAMKLLAPGGRLWTFSCSGAVDEGLFLKILAGAAVDAKRDVEWVDRLTQADDHPTPLTFPEAAYLCGFVCRVDS